MSQLTQLVSVDLVGTTSANSFIDLVASVAYVDVMGTVNAMDDHTKPTLEIAPLFPDDPGGVPEPIEMNDSLPPPTHDVTAPVAVPGTQLAWLTGRPVPGSATLGAVDPPIIPVAVDPVTEITVPSRAPIMTLLGVAPISVKKRTSAPRIAMPALSPTVTVEPRRPRRRVWEWVFGPVYSLIRRARWAYRRRRGVRASLRRLPTRS